MKKARAFTLIEVLAVTVLLGVIAAIVIPAVAGSSTAAKGSALATDLQLLRRFILVYRAQHLEVGPGYPNGDTTQPPSSDVFVAQATMASKASGETDASGDPDFNRGPYLSKIPVNPFNNKDTVEMLADGADFPADADDSHGWIYKAATCEIRADNTGSNSNGKPYYEY